MNAAVRAGPELRVAVGADGSEKRFLLDNVPWWTYVSLRDALDGAGVRMTYLRGKLELMSPSDLHEESTKLIARLVETWADEMDVDLRGFKSTTFRREANQRGLEPDECYVLGPRTPEFVPHIAIEVVVGSPLVDKLLVYAGLGVREVWIWRAVRAEFEVHGLTGERYELREKSTVVPALDLILLGRFVRPGESHTALAKGYRASLRSAG